MEEREGKSERVQIIHMTVKTWSEIKLGPVI